jgi:hypothetical protein
MNATTTAVEVLANERHACACHMLKGMYCGRLTGRTFAPGHDARIKGILQEAHREGMLVALEDGTLVSAREAMTQIAPNLVPFLYYKRGTMDARFADDAAAMADSAKRVQVKIGRWTYDALLAGSQVIVVKKNGEVITVPVADANFVGADNGQDAISA